MIEFHFVRRWLWKGKKSVEHTWLLLPPTSVIYTSELTPPPFSTTKWCSSTLTVCKRARMISAKGQGFRAGVSVKKNTYNPWASNQVSQFALRRSWNWESIDKQQQRPDHQRQWAHNPALSSSWTFRFDNILRISGSFQRDTISSFWAIRAWLGSLSSLMECCDCLLSRRFVLEPPAFEGWNVLRNEDEDEGTTA